jgi:hypothetical protein
VTSAPLPPSSALPPTSTYPSFIGSLNSTNCTLCLATFPCIHDC